MASIYAKRVQQQVDRGLESWLDFRRFGCDPHPSEIISANAEAEKRLPQKKKEDKLRGNGTGSRAGSDRWQDKPMCTTWNNSETENKCKNLIDNPSATRCNRRHDCSFCIEKGFGNFNHQRRFCRKRREAADE